MAKNYKSVKYVAFDTNRRFGVEIEINNTISRNLIKEVISNNTLRVVKATGYGQSVNNNYWHIKTDSTCGVLGNNRDYGWEIASFVGSNFSDASEMAEIARCLSVVGAVANKNCGLHVHVEINDFTTERLALLLCYWVKVEWLILEIISKERSFKYCATLNSVFSRRFGERYSDQIFSPSDLWKSLIPANCKHWNNEYRWRAVNLVNYYNSYINRSNRNTIEFRIAECRLSYDEVLNWIRFYVNFVEYVRKQPIPDYLHLYSTYKIDEAMALLGLHHDKDFYIFSAGLNKTRIWFLNKLLPNITGTPLRTVRKMLKNICGDI